MKESKKELERAIIIVGESLNIKEATEALLVNVGVYSTIRELIYKMFVEDIHQYFIKDDNVFDAISLIRKYCREMSKNGEVNFDIPYKYKITNKSIELPPDVPLIQFGISTKDNRIYNKKNINLNGYI